MFLEVQLAAIARWLTACYVGIVIQIFELVGFEVVEHQSFPVDGGNLLFVLKFSQKSSSCTNLLDSEVEGNGAAYLWTDLGQQFS